MRILLFVLALMLALSPAFAAQGTAAQWSPAKEARYQSLLGELRCMVCQNESLKASQADLAGDMRRQIHGMIARGASNEDVKQYLVARYGDYILYRPPFDAQTWGLWLGPGLLLLCGLAVIVVIVRRSGRRRGSSTYDAEALARARRRLEGDGE